MLYKSNLVVQGNSYVTKIKIPNITKFATGVYFSYNNKNYFAEAKQEVIISAGAIQSPQLLMLSDVRPAAHLKEMDIDIIKDLPVGSNLRDHPLLNIIITHNKTDDTNTSLRQDTKDLCEGRGVLSSFGGFSDVFYYSSELQENKTDPDLEFILSPVTITSILDLSNRITRIKPEI